MLQNSDNISDSILILKESIVELRRRYDFINDLYQNVRVKIITFMGAGFALLGYLYIDNSNGDNLFIPADTYGKIFYFAGLAMVLLSLVILFISLKASSWELPTDADKLKKKDFVSLEEFLIYVRNEYLKAIDLNLMIYEKKQSKLDFASHSLVIGGIVMLVIKSF